MHDRELLFLMRYLMLAAASDDLRAFDHSVRDCVEVVGGGVDAVMVWTQDWQEYLKHH
jgi:hypothetical protein